MSIWGHCGVGTVLGWNNAKVAATLGVEEVATLAARSLMRPALMSADVRLCPDSASEGTGCRGGVEGICADGLAGVYCQLCDRANGSRVYYVAASDDYALQHVSGTLLPARPSSRVAVTFVEAQHTLPCHMILPCRLSREVTAFGSTDHIV